MQSDRELLELAAKAAGWDHWDWLAAPGINVYDADGRHAHWNPLTDDGDALRLAVKLRICIEFTHCADDAPVIYCGRDIDRRDWPMEENFPDPNATTRRSIVRAAANIWLAHHDHKDGGA